MNPKILELAERRAVLIAEAEAQRRKLSQAFAAWHGPTAILERGTEAIRSLKKHPELLAGLALSAALVRPWRLVRWLPRGWAVWRIARLALGAKRILSGF